MIGTTIAQSMKLLELGLDPETADMMWIDGDLEVIKINVVETYNPDKLDMVPAWSLTKLLRLSPHTGMSGISLNNFCSGGEVWTATFECFDASAPIILKDTPLEAVFEVICWLLKKKRI